MPPRCRSFRLFAKRPSNPRDGIGETRAQRDLSTRPVNIDALLATRTIVDGGHPDCRIPYHRKLKRIAHRAALHRTAPQ